MKLKEIYSFSNKRQIWRLIPAGDNLIIEERHAGTREVFFSCINLHTGKILFRDYQPVEKFWIGIEAVHQDVVYFHKFAKPDMPGHKEIIAVDLNSLETLWSTSRYSFLFAYEGKIYSFINQFEGKKYFILDYKTGEIIQSFNDKDLDINELRYRSYDNTFFEDAFFPELCIPGDNTIAILSKKIDLPLAGRVECVKKDGYLFANYHLDAGKGILKNIFSVVEIGSEMVIFKQVLIDKTEKFVPENFFIKGDKLFLIKEKSILLVYLIN
jgi:hypothetical protein